MSHDACESVFIPCVVLCRNLENGGKVHVRTCAAIPQLQAGDPFRTAVSGSRVPLRRGSSGVLLICQSIGFRRMDGRMGRLG
jgi:hypothetical protein